MCIIYVWWSCKLDPFRVYNKSNIFCLGLNEAADFPFFCQKTCYFSSSPKHRAGTEVVMWFSSDFSCLFVCKGSPDGGTPKSLEHKSRLKFCYLSAAVKSKSHCQHLPPVFACTSKNMGTFKSILLLSVYCKFSEFQALISRKTGNRSHVLENFSWDFDFLRGAFFFSTILMLVPGCLELNIIQTRCPSFFFLL